MVTNPLRICPFAVIYCYLIRNYVMIFQILICELFEILK